MTVTGQAFRVLLVEDHEWVRLGVMALLQRGLGRPAGAAAPAAVTKESRNRRAALDGSISDPDERVPRGLTTVPVQVEIEIETLERKRVLLVEDHE